MQEDCQPTSLRRITQPTNQFNVSLTAMAVHRRDHNCAKSPPPSPLLNKVKLKSVLHRHSDRERENGALCAKKDNVICGQEERERLCLEGIVGLCLWERETHMLERIGCI